MLLLSLLAVSHAACPVVQVHTKGTDIVVPFGAVELPRASLVQPALPPDDALECPEGAVPVEVVATNWRYNTGKPQAQPGDVACLPTERQRKIYRLLATRPHPDDYDAPPVEPGTIVRIKEDEDCNPLAMSNLRPISSSMLKTLKTVQGVYRELYGNIGLHDLPYTDWGYVGLPYRYYDQLEIEAQYEPNHMVTQYQKQRALTATGPRYDEGAYYVHFLGSDPRFSDTYGTVELVELLMRIARDWVPHCRSLPDGSPNNCAVKYGDLAWYNGRRPDPLGHSTHSKGRCIDIRLLRDDDSMYEAYWNQPDDREAWKDKPDEGYSRALNEAFLQFVIERFAVDKIYFNDPAVLKAVPEVKRVRNHDDHIHLCAAEGL